MSASDALGVVSIIADKIGSRYDIDFLKSVETMIGEIKAGVGKLLTADFKSDGNGECGGKERQQKRGKNAQFYVLHV